MNAIVIKGRLTRSPELRSVQVKDGMRDVCNFDVAVNRRFGEEADFFRCQVWGKTAEFVNQFFTKGQEILVSGAMQGRKYTDKEGTNRVSWEIAADQVEFCGSKKDRDHSNGNAPDWAKPIEEDEDDDNIPF